MGVGDSGGRFAQDPSGIGVHRTLEQHPRAPAILGTSVAAPSYSIVVELAFAVRPPARLGGVRFPTVSRVLSI